MGTADGGHPPAGDGEGDGTVDHRGPVVGLDRGGAAVLPIQGEGEGFVVERTAEGPAQGVRCLAALFDHHVKGAVGPEDGAAVFALIGGDAAATIRHDQLISQEKAGQLLILVRVPGQGQAGGRCGAGDNAVIQRDTLRREQLHHLLTGLCLGGIAGGQPYSQQAQEAEIHQSQDQNDDVFQTEALHPSDLLSTAGAACIRCTQSASQLADTESPPPSA